ncbi:MAG TPA: flagellar hook-basal body complex protein FliE, partial [Phycisphaerae bacterium]|nr:flagellar hook-basal body complex protein FliE [Phycisphaerae bacterium]
MADPTINSALTSLQGISPLTTSSPASKTTAAPGKDFKDYLLQSLEKVNQLQTEADAGVQKLMTGQTDNVAEVFTATRK